MIISQTIKTIIKNREKIFNIEIFKATGINNKNSPSYINKNKIIKIKLILYWIFILVIDLKPHS